MENSKKIVFCSILLSLVLGCNKNIKNTSYIFFLNDTLCFKYYNINIGDTILLKEVDVNGEKKSLSSTIDVTTFDLLVNNMDDSIAIRNPYYIQNKNLNIFRDKYYLYFLIDSSQNSGSLKLICKTKDYKVLGGNYLKINNQIYNSIKKLQNVDVSTFKTIDVFRDRSEWLATLGIDKNYVYIGNRVLEKENAYQFHFSLNDSLYSSYFRN